MVRRAGIDVAMEGTALVAVDKLDKIGVDGVLGELEQRGIAPEAGKALLDLMSTSEDGDNGGVLARLRGADLDPAGVGALDVLEELLGLVAHTPAAGTLRLSPDLARGLSYYTGPIFEIAVPDLAGSLGGGGRYDDLVGMFGKQQVPAVGFSLGLERILVVMEERGMFPDLSTGPEIMLCWMDVDLGQVLGVAKDLRAGGLRVETFPESTKKLGKQLQYADAVGATYAVIVGSRELERGEVTIKHLESGDQQTVPTAEAHRVVRPEPS